MADADSDLDGPAWEEGEDEVTKPVDSVLEKFYAEQEERDDSSETSRQRGGRSRSR